MPNDVLLDGDFDLLFVDGDLVIGESTRQHQQLLLLSEKGEIREFPTAGVGLLSWTLDNRPGDLNGEIKRQFEQDGMTVQQVKVRVSAGELRTLEIEATYPA